MSDTQSPSPDPLETFFAAFAAVGFSYQPTATAQKNFERLCKVSGWEAKSPAHADARNGFNDALVQQFNFLYGVDGKDLATWHNLCATIGIEPVPDTIDECRKVRGMMIFVTSVCSTPRCTACLGRTCQHCRSHRSRQNGMSSTTVPHPR